MLAHLLLPGRRALPPPRARFFCCCVDEAAVTASLLRWYPEDDAVATARLITVEEEVPDMRVAYVAARAFPELGSKSQAEQALKQGKLLLNGQQSTGAVRVAQGDELSYRAPPLPRPAAKKLASTARFVGHLSSQGLAVPYEDEHLAVVFKPPGIHTKRQSNPKYAALEEALPAVVWPCEERTEDALPLPLAMHRLDVPVCGLLLVAKTRTAALGLARQLEERSVRPPRSPGQG